ncbi:MAG: hypothetical protein DHS20C01_36640 [marine bacterium B5-7]|nr:MAG: hypothetical protein DHS20C01_36640 [marine bacterium B5-7]
MSFAPRDLIKLVRYDPDCKILGHLPSVDLLVAALDHMAKLLHGEQWLLGGGVAIALNLGKFYRTHSDLDLVINCSHFSPIYERLRQNGYQLYTRKLMKHRRLGVCVHMRTQPSGILLTLRPRRLCFIKTGVANENPYLNKLDVYLFEETESEYIALDSRRRIPKRQPVRGLEYRTRSGYSLQCLNLYYVKQFSEIRGGEKHVSDVLAITKELNPAKRHP